jgi:predicted RNA-binding protein YlxR (DUF448 family)
MEAVLTPPAQESRIKPAPEHRRKCLVSGELLDKEELIRFVVGPEQNLVPDLAQKLPGRGLWVTADRASIDTAVQKKLFARAAGEKVNVSSNLADWVAELLKKRSLDLLGMAKGASLTFLGETQVEQALKAKKLALLLLADDASQPIDNPDHIPECRLFTRAELGAAFGYEQIVYAGLKSQALTKTIKNDIRRWSCIVQNNSAPTAQTTQNTEDQG